MGAKCTSQCARSFKQNPCEFRDTIPDDIDNFHPQKIKHKLPKLSFQGTISNIRIVNCPSQHEFSLKIKIDDVIEIDLPRRKVEPITELKRQSGEQIVYMQNQLKWISREKLSFLMDEYELRTHFLNVYVYDEKKQIQSQIRVNLFAIVTGPYRHDFYVKLKKHACRLLFELNLSQKIQAKLQALQIGIQLQKSYLGEQFNFSLKQLTHGQVISTSKVSTSEKVPFQVSAQSACYKELSGDLEERIDSPTQKRKLGKGNVLMMESKSNLHWKTLHNSRLTRENSMFGEINIKTMKLNESGIKHRLPHLKVFILSNQIMRSDIQFDLWIVNKNNFKSMSPSKNLEKDSVMFGMTQISLYKIFDEVYQQIEAKITSSQTDIETANFKLEVREFAREKTLISKDGQTLGKCELRFRLTNPKFFKQLNYCAKTQDGIINMTTAFKNYSGKSLYLKNTVIKDIAKISENIHALTKKLSILEATIGAQRQQIIKVEDQISDEFERINKELNNSFSASFVFPSSNLDQELLQAQDALIQILEQIYLFLVDRNGLYTDICWQVAVSIYKRGQFYLENLGFKDYNSKKSIKSVQSNRMKFAVSLRFKCILYKFLILVLQQEEIRRMNGKILWSECFKAFAYFRVPIFRKEVLGVLQIHNENLEEWKLQDFDEISACESQFRTEYEKSTNHLDWKYYFYEPLQAKEEALKLDEELIQAVQVNLWIKRLSNRESDFYYFVGYLVKILGEIGKTLKIMKWKYFPGYTKIVRSFLIEMKKRDIKDYPSTMIHSSTNLLVNEELINILMSTIVEKINIYDTQSLAKGMNIIWGYFSFITNHCKSMLPQVFNYLYFFKMIKLVFQSDSSFAIAKMLALIQKFFKCFNEEFKENLAMYMMGRVFFKLFFHWSFTIRMIFHIILISRIYFQLIHPFGEAQSQGTKTKQAFLAKHELEERYIKIKHLIYSAEYLKKDEQNNELYSFCFKDLYKKMKKKLLARNKVTQTTTQQNLTEKSSHLKPLVKEQFRIENLLKYDVAAKEKTSFFLMNTTQKKIGNKKLSRIESIDGSFESDEAAVIKRGNSFCTDDMGIEKSLKKFDFDGEEDDQVISGTSCEEKLRRQRTTIGSENLVAMRKMSESDVCPQRFKSLKVQVPQNSIRKKKVNYTYFGNQDNEIQEMSETQVRQILVAMKEYRMTLGEIEKFVRDNGRAPEFDLNVELEKDGEFQPDLLKWSLQHS